MKAINVNEIMTGSEQITVKAIFDKIIGHQFSQKKSSQPAS